MAFDRRQIVEANGDFRLELRHSGVPRPVVFPERGGPDAPGSNTIGNRSETSQEKGLVCRACGCRMFTVIETRQAYNGRIMRRRRCRNCNKQMIKYE
jgi:hypothetical protein